MPDLVVVGTTEELCAFISQRCPSVQPLVIGKCVLLPGSGCFCRNRAEHNNLK